jgi:hypothetical protein
MKNTKIVELVIDEDNNEALTIDAISLVHSPAIEENLVFFGKDKNNLTFAKVDEEKRMLVSPALIPNKQIFRYDPNTDQEYYVYFSPETVRKSAELYLKHNNHHKATYEHQDRVAGVLTTESWIIEDPKMDKSKLYGYNLPKGSWMVSMKITNDELWDRIKAGEIKGLSIEGYFVDKMQKMSEQEPTDEEILSALNDIIQERTELKAKKIELGLVEDFEKLFNKSLDASVKIGTTFIDAVSKAQSKYKSNISDMEKALKIGNEIKKSAKELGIDLPKAVMNKIDSAEANIKEEKGIISKLQKLYNLF